ncbi:RecQ family ATP-dependent DNA helicase [Candidatus Thiosymbion oneisti]|uniref:RecQ family ATP-dependent DNA helicase n=1 Tax=Candidatus Thiosymbion oneisti TaxID=589554 RepID=UPI000AD01415|nr:RecQ family ATP-dependent DNA helicase [Candidatus Thiosymbion oneisti]
MPADVQAALKRHFGFETFRPGQEAVVAHLMAGHSAAAVFPTGGGKSLCYQLPALLLPGLTLVVSPLIALMKDQIDALTRLGIAAARLDSTLDAAAHRTVMEQVRKGTLRLLYVAPERFNNERFREAITPVRISLFAVDEAHCISEWGHNFRPDYLKLAGFARACGAERVLALTATATERVLADICDGLAIDAERAVRTGFYRPNLSLTMTPVSAAERDGSLLTALRANPPGPTIIYVTLQRTAEELAERLVAAGCEARAYHAGMQDVLRAEIQDWFMASDQAIVVATIAFGMGIDKANIRYVYHYNLPKSLENYSQEIGRAGRDGEPAICHMLVCPDDLNVLENFIYGDTPDPNAVRGLIRDIFARGSEFDVSLYELAFEHDIRPLVLRTLLTYLELKGFLAGGTPLYGQYRFQPLLTSREILARFEGARRTFLADLFRQARQGRSWFHIDPGAAAMVLGTDRERIIRALDWLGEQQMLRVEARGLGHRYRRLQSPTDPAALADELHQYGLKREAAELGRLRQVLELASRNACQTAALAAHFGERLEEACGHCSWCRSGGSELPERDSPEIPPDLRDQVNQLVSTAGGALDEPGSLARFLCGIPSPRLSRVKLGKQPLGKHPLAGTLTRVPFRTVLEWASAGRPHNTGNELVNR